jgi:hypothetical protein
MRPGACRILACPHCNTWLRSQCLELEQRLGVTVWSDLRVDHGFWQSPVHLVQCHSCGQMFRKAEAEQVGMLPSSHETAGVDRTSNGWQPWPWRRNQETALMARFEAAPLTVSLSESATEAALAEAGRDDEADLRLQLWRHHNDRLRGRVGGAFAEIEQEWRDNQDRLLDVLDDDNELHQLLAAEIHRQRTDFPRAMGRLSRVRQRFGREKAALMGWIVEGRSDLQVFY